MDSIYEKISKIFKKIKKNTCDICSKVSHKTIQFYCHIY